MASRSVTEILLIPFQFVWYLFLTLLYALIGLIYAFVPSAILPKKDVSNDIVLITGGGCGFGRLFALEFTKLGSTVVIWDIDERGAQKVAKECEELGGKAYAFKVDVSKSKDVYRTADDVRKKVGDVTILINNAGVVSGSHLLDTSDDMINRTIDINVKAYFWTVKAFARSMLENNHGHFVSVCSMAGYYGGPKQVDYCASKHAVVGFEESLYLDFELNKKSGVFTTIINPFYMDTGMFTGVESTKGLLPVLSAEFVMKKSMVAILTNERYVYLPYLTRLYIFLKSFLPENSMWALRTFFGIEGYMGGFTGRQKSD